MSVTIRRSRGITKYIPVLWRTPFVMIIDGSMSASYFLMNRCREDWTFGVSHDPFSRAAAERIEEPMVALCSHDDETGVVFHRSLQDLLLNVPVSVCPQPF